MPFGQELPFSQECRVCLSSYTPYLHNKRDVSNQSRVYATSCKSSMLIRDHSRI